MPTDTTKRNKRQYQWQKENTERLNLLFVKGTKEKIQRAAQNRGISISEYVSLSIERQIQEDEKQRPDLP